MSRSTTEQLPQSSSRKEPLLPPGCPVPHTAGDRIVLAHGEGGRLTRRLIRDVLLAELDNEFLRLMNDAAVVPPMDRELVITTDSYVVSPLFFPGGDIGKLAVHGTINDLAVSGAEPLYLSLSLIIEEGLPLETFQCVIHSIGKAAQACRVPVVTGDTKVVPVGAADGLFVNTTGIGQLRPGTSLGAHRVRPGDRVLVSGTIGDHGISILSARERLELGSTLRSDTKPLHGMVQSLLDSGVDIRFMRDPTRGGVSAVLHELAESGGLSIVLEEGSLPLSEPVRGACELLGLDPLYVANEGKLIAIVSQDACEWALRCMKKHPLGADAAIIGEVLGDSGPQVLVRGPLGSLRALDEPTGAPLPRIC